MGSLMTEYNMSEDLGIMGGDLILCELTECQAKDLKEVMNRANEQSERSKAHCSRLDERIEEHRRELERIKGGGNADASGSGSSKRTERGAVEKGLRIRERQAGITLAKS